MDTGTHGTEDLLERYVLGRLPEADVVELEEHLFLCDQCRDKLEEFGAFAPALREELRKPAAEKAPFEWFGWLSRPGFGMAAAFAAMVLALGIYWIGGTAGPAPVASLQLISMRGEAQPTAGPARELDLTIADAPVAGGPFQVEIVDASGGKIWTGTAGDGQPTNRKEGLQVKVTKRLSPGDYFARLYGAGGQLVHEYAFRVKG